MKDENNNAAKVAMQIAATSKMISSATGGDSANVMKLLAKAITATVSQSSDGNDDDADTGGGFDFTDTAVIADVAADAISDTNDTGGGSGGGSSGAISMIEQLKNGISNFNKAVNSAMEGVGGGGTDGLMQLEKLNKLARPQRSDEHFFKTIRAHAAAKLPPTLGPFRTRSNPTLAQP